MTNQSLARMCITDGITTVDFFDPSGGWLLEEPGWLPSLSGLKGGGAFVNPALADGQTLVQGEYGNVTETIPLLAYGNSQRQTIATLRDLLRLLYQAADYWRRPYEHRPVWLEFRPAGIDCFTGFTWLYSGQIAGLPSPTGQPFYAENELSRLEALSLILTREPFWRSKQPLTMLGPLFNLLKNPDFELWTQPPGAITDVEPDSWINQQSTGVTGTNNREASIIYSGRFSLKVDIDSIYDAGRKGVYQVVASTEDETTYTMIAWVRNTGIQLATGRILITYDGNELEVYRRADRHGWKLFMAKFTTGRDQVVTVFCEILGTDAAGAPAVYENAEGSIYFDSLMLLEGDHEADAAAGILPYMTSSHVVNHTDIRSIEAGDINYLDVWNVPGDVDALVRVESLNNTTPSDWTDPDEVVAMARIGQRRTGDVFDFGGYHDPPGTLETTASSDDVVTLAALGTGWTTITSKTISGGALTPSNSGRFRLYARVRDNLSSGAPTVELRVTYWTGSANINSVQLDAVPVRVSREWCVTDLTPRQAINWDTKFLADQPGALGYKIEARRTNDVTGNLLFDWAQLFPTDGGMVVAEIDPPVTPDNALVVDDTSFGSVQTSAKRSSSIKLLWEDAMASATSEVYAMASFQGRLFVTGALSSEVNVFQTRVWDGIRWIVITASYIITALAEFDGRLYGGTDGGDVYVWTGSAWSLVENTAAGLQITDMAVFDESLFVLNNAGNAYQFDGAVWTNPFDVAGGGNYGKLAVYNNRLFASQGEGGGAVSVWDGTALTIVGTPAGMTQVTALAAQGGFLWIGGNGQGIANYDGENLTVDTDFITNLADAEQVYDLVDYDGTVYAVTTWVAARSGRVYRRGSDGVWDGIARSRLTAVYSGRVLAVYDGSLFVGSLGYVPNVAPAVVLSLSAVDVWNKVTNYQGSLFRAPVETRHRYVFSWDRENEANVVDDRLLVGIGFVPRYFSLRGKG